MPLLHWSEDLRTNIRAIDNDHQMLIDIINALYDAAQARDATLCEHGLSALVNHMEEHFRREESFMRASGYPKLPEHMRRHQELSFAVYEIQHMYHQDPDSLQRPEVWEFLSNWLAMHTRGCDMDYVPYLQGRAEAGPQEPPLEEPWRAVTIRVPASALPALFRAAAMLGEEGGSAGLRRLLDRARDS